MKNKKTLLIFTAMVIIALTIVGGVYFGKKSYDKTLHPFDGKILKLQKVKDDSNENYSDDSQQYEPDYILFGTGKYSGTFIFVDEWYVYKGSVMDESYTVNNIDESFKKDAADSGSKLQTYMYKNGKLTLHFTDYTEYFIRKNNNTFTATESTRKQYNKTKSYTATFVHSKYSK